MLNGFPLMESGKRTTVSSTQSSTVYCCGSISSLCDLTKLDYSRVYFGKQNIAFITSKAHTRNKRFPLLYSSISSDDMRLHNPFLKQIAALTHITLQQGTRRVASFPPLLCQELAGDPLVVESETGICLQNGEKREERKERMQTEDEEEMRRSAGNTTLSRSCTNTHDRSIPSRRRLSLICFHVSIALPKSSQTINKRSFFHAVLHSQPMSTALLEIKPGFTSRCCVYVLIRLHSFSKSYDVYIATHLYQVT